MNKIMVYCTFCILFTVGLAVWTWTNLPVLENYPVHWNAAGEPDRFGTKTEVLFALMIIPVTAVISALVFYFLPKIEPIRKNVKPNKRPYGAILAVMMAIYVLIQLFITKTYAGIEAGGQSATISTKYLIAGLSFFILIIGNLMSKLRQNFMIGVRTPWTLSSDLSWEKTHRLAGRLLVLTGLVGMIAAVSLREETALQIFIALVIGVSLSSLIYSFVVWKSDPEKRV